MHSAYRSSLLVKTYKQQGGKYIGKKDKSSGLNRWMCETWLNSRGEVGYKYASDIYRPTVRVNKSTPTTFQELTQKQIDTARKEKQKQEQLRSLTNKIK